MKAIMDVSSIDTQNTVCSTADGCFGDKPDLIEALTGNDIENIRAREAANWGGR